LNSEVLKRKRNHAIGLLKQLISIPSSNPHISDQDENRVAEFLREELESAGLEVELQQVTSSPYYGFEKGRARTRPNVIARTGFKDRTKLILNGHIDTVTGDTMKRAFEPREVGDKLYGRGSSDMKGGVAAIVAATEAVRESNPNLEGQIVLSLVVDEETRGQGTKEFLKKEQGDFAIVAEPTENTLGLAQAGYLDFNIYSRGQSRHGQTTLPELWTSAFVQTTNLCNLILEDKMILRQKRHNGLHMSSTFNFSPTAYAPPPSYSWMTMEEFRANCLLGLIPETTIRKSAQSARTALNRIKKTVVKGNRHGQRSRFELIDSNLGFIQAENGYTKNLEKAMDKILGHHRHSYMLSFCDAAYFYRAGIPTVLFGPGRMDLGHSTRECTSKRQVMEATSVFAYAIENILKSSVS
jgi:acetylornithine deacetylase/succinyl-diaminopimelate desuccinylase-like protein